MILEPKQIAIAYRCPECASTVISAVGVLLLTGDLLKLKCDCGGSELVITKTSDGKYRFSVPCVFCGTAHSFIISRKTLTSKELFTVPCSYAGIDVLFIGEKKAVMDAIEVSDRQLDELLEENEAEKDDIIAKKDSSPYGDPHLQDLILFSLGELAEDGDIVCGCEASKGDYVCDPYPDRVEITCKNCGYKKEILCEEGSIGAHVLFDCERLFLLPPENTEDKK